MLFSPLFKALFIYCVKMSAYSHNNYWLQQGGQKQTSKKCSKSDFQKWREQLFPLSLHHGVWIYIYIYIHSLFLSLSIYVCISSPSLPLFVYLIENITLWNTIKKNKQYILKKKTFLISLPPAAPLFHNQWHTTKGKKRILYSVMKRLCIFLFFK